MCGFCLPWRTAGPGLALGWPFFPACGTRVMGMKQTQVTDFAKLSTSASGRKEWEWAVRRRKWGGKRERRPVSKAPNFQGEKGQKSLKIWVLPQVQLSMKIKNLVAKPQQES